MPWWSAREDAGGHGLALVLRALLLAMVLASGPVRAGDAKAGAERAAEFAFAHGAVAFVALRGDDTVLARYADGLDPHQLQMLFSGSKAFSCVIAAAAVDDGLLGWDMPVEQYIAEWRGSGRSGITVRNLLSLDSGLDPAQGAGLDSPFITEQSVAAALQARVVAPPGRRFGYGPYPFLVFSEVVRRVTGMEAGDYLAQRVLDPIAARAEWLPTADGHTHLADGALMAPGDWLAFGKLVRDGGRWQGKQVLREATLAECFKPSRANRTYGVGWWLDSRVASCAAGPARSRKPCLVSALGRYSNALHVVPDADLVVLVLGSTHGRQDDIDQHRLLRLLLADQRR